MEKTRKVLEYKDLLRENIQKANINIQLILDESVNLKNNMEFLINNKKKLEDNPGNLKMTKTKRIVEKFKSETGMVTQCFREGCE